MLALVITGPPGAGKSEVAAALHDSLGDAGEDVRDRFYRSNFLDLLGPTATRLAA